VILHLLECQFAHSAFLCKSPINSMTIDHKICTNNPSNCAALPFLATFANLLAIVLIISRWQVLMENLG